MNFVSNRLKISSLAIPAVLITASSLFVSVIASRSSEAWLWLYSLDAACVIIGASLSNYLGVVGFFVLTATTGVLFAIVWCSIFTEVFILRGIHVLDLGSLCKFYGLDISLVLYVDYIGYSFALLTTLISTFVYMYAFSYMRFERGVINFLAFFKLFGWSMTLLVLSGSWFTLLLGWELIGITSFLLINYWTSKIGTLKSAFKAFVFNKISDACLILAVCISLSAGLPYLNPSLAFANSLAGMNLSFGGITFSYASVFLAATVIAAFCKSAQFGFHFWLPDSMEAPVPASALIHSATLVSAGIYLLLRFNSLFLVCDYIYSAVCLLSAFTAFYGAVIAAFQTDVKKILAYSTISHCGMLIFSTLLNAPYITLFYLFAHGFFKSINFMCVGNFIQYSNNYQDTSKMGRYFSLFKFEFFFFCITLFNLSSAPLFFCFFSKHWLIGAASTQGLSMAMSVAWVYAAAFCGAFYSSKLLFECTMSLKRSHQSLYAVNSIEDLSGSFRRSNALSRAAMSLLFIVAFLTLFILWSLQYSGAVSDLDDFGSSLSRSYGSSFYAIFLFFSWVLILTASGYVSFRRVGSWSINWASISLFFFLACLVF